MHYQIINYFYIPMIFLNTGNIFGFVKLLKTGLAKFQTKSNQFIPDLKRIPNFEELASKEGLSDEALEDAKVLDDILASTTTNSTSKIDFSQV